MPAHDLLVSPIEYLAPEKLLDGLTAAQAAERIANAPHTIVEILAHLDFWQRWFLDRCQGTPTSVPEHAAPGWPAAAAADWEPLRTSFLNGLAQAAALDPLAPKPVTPPIELPFMAHYTIGDVITHLAIHNAHHLGQIATLRQLQGSWPPPAGSWTW
ncbi:MAG: DinB family protein [Bryobacterales bacterium]|nr:DinB family protein [Bryobacterales bacterium]